MKYSDLINEASPQEEEWLDKTADIYNRLYSKFGVVFAPTDSKKPSIDEREKRRRFKNFMNSPIYIAFDDSLFAVSLNSASSLKEEMINYFNSFLPNFEVKGSGKNVHVKFSSKDPERCAKELALMIQTLGDFLSSQKYDFKKSAQVRLDKMSEFDNFIKEILRNAIRNKEDWLPIFARNWEFWKNNGKITRDIAEDMANEGINAQNKQEVEKEIKRRILEVIS
jgi:hypothetical protein